MSFGLQTNLSAPGAHSLGTVAVTSATSSFSHYGLNSNGGSLLVPQRSSVKASRSARGKGTLSNGIQYISAIDHLSTKLRIPLSAVQPTQALDDDGLVPGLCRLYMEGQCRQSERCYQVHADQAVVERLRVEAHSAPSCCHVHGAACNYDGFPLGLTIIVECGQQQQPHGNGAREHAGGQSLASLHGSFQESPSFGVRHPLDAIITSNGNSPLPAGSAPSSSNSIVLSLQAVCPTGYLWNLYKRNGGMQLHVPKGKVCREHRKGLCRFGDECNFLHACRQTQLDGEIPADDLAKRRTALSHRQSVSGSFDEQRHHVRIGPQVQSYSHFNCAFGHPNHLQQTCADVSPSSSFPDARVQSMPILQRGTLSAAPGEIRRAPLLCPIGKTSSSALSLRHGSFSHNPYGEASLLQ